MGARAGEKEQQGLEREIEEEARELLVQFPATPEGDHGQEELQQRTRGSSRRIRGSSRRSRWSLRRARVRGDGGGGLPGGRRIAQLGGAGPCRRRRKAEEEDGDGGTYSRWF